MTIEPPTHPVFDVVQALLGSGARAQELANLWEKAGGGQAPDDPVLLSAAVLMAAAEQPSPAAALSAARSLVGQSVGDSLVALAQAWAALESAPPLSPVFANLVAAAVQASARQLDAWAERTISE